jgi:nitrogen regulatory protein PII
MKAQFSHITIIIHMALVKKLYKHLAHIGIDHLYSSYGRSMVLNEPTGLLALFKKSDLTSDPVEVVHFYAPIEIEDYLMRSIIKTCRLDIPGRGSVFSHHVDIHNSVCTKIICLKDFIKEEDNQSDEIEAIPLFSNMTQILCTLSKGLADDVAKFLLHLGIVPTITNAAGTGLRDQLGLLRITIPKEKELLTIVVGNQEANSVMEKIISWGKLDRPGRGFVWQVPVHKGMINHKSSPKTIGHAASAEQIISAIDSIKGSIAWRQGGNEATARKRRNFFQGHEFMMQSYEGASVLIAKNLMSLGISGVTVQPIRTIAEHTSEENIIVPQEIIRVVLTESQAARLTKKIQEESTVDEPFIPSQTNAFSVRSKKAFNYRSQDLKHDK